MALTREALKNVVISALKQTYLDKGNDGMKGCTRVLERNGDFVLTDYMWQHEWQIIKEGVQLWDFYNYLGEVDRKKYNAWKNSMETILDGCEARYLEKTGKQLFEEAQ